MDVHKEYSKLQRKSDWARNELNEIEEWGRQNLAALRELENLAQLRQLTESETAEFTKLNDEAVKMIERQKRLCAVLNSGNSQLDQVNGAVDKLLGDAGK